MIDLITKDIRELTVDELKILLEHYENHEEKYKYEFRIRQIERTIRIRERAKNRAPEWVELAKEDKATKEKWLKLGATWRNIGSTIVTWEYKGKKFYTWHSGKHINQEIHRLRDADKRLMKMIEEESK